MKKYILFSLFIIFIFVAFNKTILSKIIVFSLSKWVERDFLVKEVNINYSAKEIVLNPGDNFHVYRGLKHQMIALEDTELFEFSTQHFDSDSYRILKGD